MIRLSVTNVLINLSKFFNCARLTPRQHQGEQLQNFRAS